MKRQRSGSRAGGVVVADERHGGGEVKRLAETFERANGDEVPEFSAPARHHRDEAPEEASAEDQVFAPRPVGDVSGHRCAESVDPHERRPDQAELGFGEVKFALELWEDGENRLPIAVVEEANEPEHADDEPFVDRTRCRARSLVLKGMASVGSVGDRRRCHEKSMLTLQAPKSSDY